MKITLVCVGKLKEKYWREAAAEYIKRLSGYCTLRVVEVADENIDSASEGTIKQKEAAGILAKIAPRDFVIALDMTGTALSSPGLSELMSSRMSQGVSAFTLVIGGSLGLAPAVLSRADYRLSASALTFPHQLMRVILLEQLYRAFKIMRGEAYHH